MKLGLFVRFGVLGLLLVPSTMRAAPTPTATPVAILPITVSQLAADPIRPRVYGTSTGSNSVVVIDTTTLKVIKEIPIGSAPQGLRVSADNSKLWVANSGSTTHGVGVLDLDTLTPLPSIAAPGRPFDVEEGLSRRLYLTASTDFQDVIAQINADTGEFEGTVGEDSYNEDSPFLETSPDRKTLFASTNNININGSPGIRKFDISTTAARGLQQQQLSEGEAGLSISHNGRFIVMPGYATYKIPTSDLSAVDGTFFPGGDGRETATWSNDDTLLYHTVQNIGVKAFNTTSFGVVKEFQITYSDSSPGDFNDLVVDKSGQWLFVAIREPNSLQIFSTGRNDPLKPRPTPAPITFTAQSLNISTRANIQTGNNVLIGGFIITGTKAKDVIVRAIGPSLPIVGALSDPILELHLPGGAVVTNDNWKVNDSTKQSQEKAVRGTTVPPANDRESAIVLTLDPGTYTAIVRGTNDATGIGLVEVYDLDGSTESRLANISSRSYVAADYNVLIAGFIAGPADTVSSRVVIRALGPSLPVAGRLSDPTLELHNSDGAKIATNDDYVQDGETRNELDRLNLAPKDERESALFQVLAPGTYTAIVRGKDLTSGIGLVEVYNLR